MILVDISSLFISLKTILLLSCKAALAVETNVIGLVTNKAFFFKPRDIIDKCSPAEQLEIAMAYLLPT